ncbi:hypothetical protein V7149_01880 [Bacillus sp. JJ1503]|uniref:hypothetical protein n=1 Tax=Bacillus sp. JJ1503 TaxID=3122956 RepID=UPI002FFF4B22
MLLPYSHKDEIPSLVQEQKEKGLTLLEVMNITEGNFLLFGIPIPKVPTSEERIKALEEERLGLQLALAESIEKQEIDKINNQLAMAELIETLTIKGVL